MPISWNEIRHNAIKFSREWAGVKSESAEKQTFWNEFFQVFGLKRRVVASHDMRNALPGCTRKDWSRISPAIFVSVNSLESFKKSA